MHTFRLPILPMIAGLVLLIAGYHFAAIELKIAGSLFMAWATITHFKNIRLARTVYKRGTFVRDYVL